MKKIISIFLLLTLIIGAIPYLILAQEETQSVSAENKNCFGRSAHFDGEDDALEVEAPIDASFFHARDSQYFTIEAWIRPVLTDRYVGYAVIAREFMGYDSNLEFSIIDSKLFAKVNTLAGFHDFAGAQVTGQSLILANIKWYHVALVRRGKYIQLYLDGQPDSPAVEIKETGIQVPSGGALVIGGQLLTTGLSTIVNNFNGHIDEVRISDAARYLGEYNVPTAPFSPDANTLALWHMDETPTSQIAYDSALILPVESGRNNAIVRGSERMFEESTIPCPQPASPGNVIPKITTMRIPSARKGHPVFNFNFTITDKNTQDKLTLSAEGLPEAVTMVCPKNNRPGRLDCTLDGIPQKVGTFYFTLNAKDDKGGTSSKNFALRVTP